MSLRRSLSTVTALVFAFTAAACGGGEQAGNSEGGQMQAESEMNGGGEMAAAQEAGGELTVPDWMTVDEQNQTVTLDLTAGQNDANNSWNYNGYHSGNATIVVPQGYEVTINFENADQVNPHSVGVDSQVGDYPATFQEASPVFEGGVTSGATKMSSATQPGASETITFTASEAGQYALVCYVPAHATQGMWIHFNVSADGEAGFRESG